MPHRQPRSLFPVIFYMAAICAGGLAAMSTSAAELRVRILDREGKPVADVVVTAQNPQTPTKTSAARTKPAVMDQIDKQFVPHILVIQAGTTVAFPNSDTVAHQVYSFSPAHRFQLPLYHGQTHAPEPFDEPGIVVLGCNIHDSMIAYIYVAPTPYFGKTDAGGTVTLTDLPAGAYELSIWSPRFNEPTGQIRKTAHVGADGAAPVEIRLTHALRAEHGSGGTPQYDY